MRMFVPPHDDDLFMLNRSDSISSTSSTDISYRDRPNDNIAVTPRRQRRRRVRVPIGYDSYDYSEDYTYDYEYYSEMGDAPNLDPYFFGGAGGSGGASEPALTVTALPPKHPLSRQRIAARKFAGTASAYNMDTSQRVAGFLALTFEESVVISVADSNTGVDVQTVMTSALTDGARRYEDYMYKKGVMPWKIRVGANALQADIPGGVEKESEPTTRKGKEAVEPESDETSEEEVPVSKEPQFELSDSSDDESPQKAAANVVSDGAVEMEPVPIHSPVSDSMLPGQLLSPDSESDAGFPATQQRPASRNMSLSGSVSDSSSPSPTPPEINEHPKIEDVVIERPADQAANVTTRDTGGYTTYEDGNGIHRPVHPLPLSSVRLARRSSLDGLLDELDSISTPSGPAAGPPPPPPLPDASYTPGPIPRTSETADAAGSSSVVKEEVTSGKFAYHPNHDVERMPANTTSCNMCMRTCDQVGSAYYWRCNSCGIGFCNDCHERDVIPRYYSNHYHELWPITKYATNMTDNNCYDCGGVIPNDSTYYKCSERCGYPRYCRRCMCSGDPDNEDAQTSYPGSAFTDYFVYDVERDGFSVGWRMPTTSVSNLYIWVRRKGQRWRPTHKHTLSGGLSGVARITNTTPGKQYEVVVVGRSYRCDSEVPASDGIFAAQMECTTPLHPESVGFEALTDCATLIKWSPPRETGGAPITGYRVYQRKKFADFDADAGDEGSGVGTPLGRSRRRRGKRRGGGKTEESFYTPSTDFGDKKAEFDGEDKDSGSTPADDADGESESKITPEDESEANAGDTPTGNEDTETPAAESEPKKDKGKGPASDTPTPSSTPGWRWVFVTSVAGTELCASVDGLDAGCEYQFAVTAVNAVGESQKSQVRAGTLISAPTNFRSTAVGANHVAFAWDAPPLSNSPDAATVQCYCLKRYPAKPESSVASKTIFCHSPVAVVTGLLANREGFYTVQAISQAGGGGECAEIQVKTLEGPPQVPYNVRFNGLSHNTVRLQWTQPLSGGVGISGYLVELTKKDIATGHSPAVIRPTAYSDFVAVDGLSDPSSPEVTFTDLDPGSQYGVVVTAFCDAGCSPKSAECTFLTHAVAPTNITAEPSSSNSVVLRWAPACPLQTEFVYKYTGVDGEAAEKNHTFTSNALTATTFMASVMSLMPGSTYAFQVASVYKGVTSEFSPPVKAKTLGTIPGVAQNLKLTDVTRTSLTVKWKAPESDGGSEITGYTLEHRIAGSTDWKKGALQQIPSARVVGLRGGTEYFFRVMVHNENGGSPYTEVVTGKTTSSVPEAPRNIHVSATEATTMTVSWTEPASDGGEPLTDYRLQRGQGRSADDFDVTIRVGPDVTTMKVSKLKPQTWYRWRLIARNSIGDSVPTDVAVDHTYIEHAFEKRHFGGDSVCNQCGRNIRGMFKNGVACTTCDVVLHLNCQEAYTHSCRIGID